MYIKFNNSDEHYEASLQSFITQNGNAGIRIVGDVPENTSGFKLYDGDNVIGNFSKFTHIYNPNEYTKTEEEKVPSHSDYVQSSPSVISALASSVSSSIGALSQKVEEITPYTESKTAYIDDTEVLFDMAKEGNVSVYMVDGEGQNVPFTFERINGQVRVSFDKRDSLATVTISIQ